MVWDMLSVRIKLNDCVVAVRESIFHACLKAVSQAKICWMGYMHIAMLLAELLGCIRRPIINDEIVAPRICREELLESGYK